jgi:hypothetical protein
MGNLNAYYFIEVRAEIKKILNDFKGINPEFFKFGNDSDFFETGFIEIKQFITKLDEIVMLLSNIARNNPSVEFVDLRKIDWLIQRMVYLSEQIQIQQSTKKELIIFLLEFNSKMKKLEDLLKECRT